MFLRGKIKYVIIFTTLLMVLIAVIYASKGSLRNVRSSLNDLVNEQSSSVDVIVHAGFLIKNADGTAASIQGFSNCKDGKNYDCILFNQQTKTIPVYIRSYTKEQSEKLSDVTFVGGFIDVRSNENLMIKRENDAYILYRSNGDPVIPWKGATLLYSDITN